MITINIANDFSRYPSGRYKKHGDTSGEEFRERFLIPHLQKNEKITVEFDGAIGYGSSFLEEAFGGLVRQLKISPDTILKNLSFTSSDPTYIQEATQYIRDAGNELK